MKSDNVKVGMQQAPHRSLFNALGMTEEEYFLWIEDNSNLKYIVLAHKNNINIKELLKTE